MLEITKYSLYHADILSKGEQRESLKAASVICRMRLMFDGVFDGELHWGALCLKPHSFKSHFFHGF